MVSTAAGLPCCSLTVTMVTHSSGCALEGGSPMVYGLVDAGYELALMPETRSYCRSSVGQAASRVKE